MEEREPGDQPPPSGDKPALGLANPFEQLKTLWRYKWFIATFPVLFIVLTALVLSTIQPTYRATAQLLIQPRKPQAVPLESLEQQKSPLTYDEYQNTQLAILRSRSVAKAVAHRLNLKEVAAFTPQKAKTAVETEPVAEKGTRQARDEPTGGETSTGSPPKPETGGDNSRIEKLWHSTNQQLGRFWSTASDKIEAAVAFVQKWTGVLSAFTQNLAVTLGFVDRDTKTEQTPSNDRFIRKVQSHIAIQPIPNTNVFKVHGKSQDPQLAAKISNAVIEAYIQTLSQARKGSNVELSNWLQNRLNELKARLQRSQEALHEFYEAHELVAVGDGRALIKAKLADYSQRYRKVKAKLAELETVYQKIVAAHGNIDELQDISRIQQDPLVQSTKRNLIEARQLVSKLSTQYGYKHPKMIQAKQRLAAAREAYYKQVRIAARGLKSEYRVAKETAASLKQLMRQAREQLQEIGAKTYKLKMLKQEVKANRKLVSAFITKYKALGVARGLNAANIRVLDKAVVPVEPYKPRTTLWLATVLLLGLFVGVVLAFVLAFLDQTIKDPEDLEHTTKLPVLSVLPLLSNKRKTVARIGDNVPNSAFWEAIRTLRTGLSLADVPDRKGKILITSATPGEGKSCVAANLAMAFGQVEDTLLLEADLRKPSLAKYLNIKVHGKGVGAVLSGNATAEEAIQQIPDTRVHILACDQLPTNPAELLGSPQFESLLDNLSDHFGRIIVDSPPVGVVSDAMVLGRLTDAALVVAHADAVHRKLVEQAIRRLKQADANVLGSILNQVEPKKRGYAAGYYGYYDEGYYGGKKTVKLPSG